MRLTLRDLGETLVVLALAAGYVGLVQAASWMPITSVRWFAVLFVVVGQAACALGAADALADRTSGGAGFVLGPVALVAGLLAVVTGSETVLGVGVLAMAGLWLLTTSRHALHRKAVRR